MKPDSHLLPIKSDCQTEIFYSQVQHPPPKKTQKKPLKEGFFKIEIKCDEMMQFQ